MPQDSDFTTIVANTTQNVLAGRLFERLGGRGAVIKGYAACTAGVVGDLQSTFISGSDVIGLNCGLGIAANGPQIPENQVVSGTGLPGDPLQWNITNTTAGNLIVGWLLDITNV